MRHWILFLFLLGSFVSCKPDPVLTTGERIAQTIQAQVGPASRLQVTAFGNGVVSTDTALRIDGALIQVGQSYYNLAQLVRYTYNSQQGILTLYFP